MLPAQRNQPSFVDGLAVVVPIMLAVSWTVFKL